MLSQIRRWLNERWPFSFLAHLALDEEIPGGSRYSYTLGSALLTVFVLQAATGILQLFYYIPAVDHAYDSINFLRTRIPFGWLVNGLHYWGANAMIIIITLHISRVFVWGAYKRPRELTWLFGVSLLLIVMGMSFTGGPLSWDQKAYWEAEVGTSIPGSIPVVGDMIKQIMRGGEEMGQLTLSRLFVVHTAILPAILVILMAAHLIAFRKSGSVGPWDEAQRGVKGQFWPEQVFKDALISTIVILSLITLAIFAPKAFNGAADPLDSQFVPKPEWNFLFLYEALKFFPGRLEPIGAMGFPLVLILPLVLLPFLDRNPERNPLKRPIIIACGILFWGTIAAFTIAGYYSKPAAGEVPVPPSLVPRTAAVSPPVQNGAQLFQSQGCIGCHRVNDAGGTIGPDLSGEGLSGRTSDWLITQIRNPKTHDPDSVMPVFSTLSDKDVNALVDYLLSLRGKITPVTEQKPAESSSDSVSVQTSPAPQAEKASGQTSQNAVFPSRNQPGRAADIIGSAERGAILFKMECMPCHGPDGTDKVPNPGSADGTVPPLNPIDRELFNKDLKEFTENIDKYLQHGSTPEGPNPSHSMPAFGDSNSLTQQQIANVEAYILQLNGINRADMINPGMKPQRFFFMVVPAFIIIMLLLVGIYRSFPRAGQTEEKNDE
jgi:ubiquinol-cytochrome c reductase cytochrome b subunit